MIHHFKFQIYGKGKETCATGGFPMSCRNAAARHRVYRGTHNKDTRFRMQQTLYANNLRQNAIGGSWSHRQVE